MSLVALVNSAPSGADPYTYAGDHAMRLLIPASSAAVAVVSGALSVGYLALGFWSAVLLYGRRKTAWWWRLEHTSVGLFIASDPINIGLACNALFILVGLPCIWIQWAAFRLDDPRCFVASFEMTATIYLLLFVGAWFDLSNLLVSALDFSKTVSPARQAMKPWVIRMVNLTIIGSLVVLAFALIVLAMVAYVLALAPWLEACDDLSQALHALNWTGAVTTDDLTNIASPLAHARAATKDVGRWLHIVFALRLVGVVFFLLVYLPLMLRFGAILRWQIDRLRESARNQAGRHVHMTDLVQRPVTVRSLLGLVRSRILMLIFLTATMVYYAANLSIVMTIPTDLQPKNRLVAWFYVALGGFLLIGPVPIMAAVSSKDDVHGAHSTVATSRWQQYEMALQRQMQRQPTHAKARSSISLNEPAASTATLS